MVDVVSFMLPRYVKLEEKMKLLWDAEMRVNTVGSISSVFHETQASFGSKLMRLPSFVQVHVSDVCRALWHLTTAGDDSEIYNLVDKNDTSERARKRYFACMNLSN
jgi:hypothetical protein